jgi:tetratricopeptide (TPR) repeat protein
MSRSMRVLLISLIVAMMIACAPRAPAPVEAATDPALDPLFEQLGAAPGAAEAAQAEQQIWQVWSRTGSATVDVLIERAGAAQAQGDMEVARAFMDDAVALLPGAASVWYHRAVMRLEAEDLAGGLSDLDETLRREPRHFAALASLAVVYEGMGQEARALAAYREALAIHPNFEAAQQGVTRLAPKLEGRET